MIKERVVEIEDNANQSTCVVFTEIGERVHIKGNHCSMSGAARSRDASDASWQSHPIGRTRAMRLLR